MPKRIRLKAGEESRPNDDCGSQEPEAAQTATENHDDRVDAASDFGAIATVTTLSQAFISCHKIVAQVKDQMAKDCTLMFECEFCKTVFRSLGNFVRHKQGFCQADNVGTTSDASKPTAEIQQPTYLPTLPEINLAPNVAWSVSSSGSSRVSSSMSPNVTLAIPRPDHTHEIRRPHMVARMDPGERKKYNNPNSPVRLITCSVCASKYADYDQLLAHISDKHDASSVLHSCPVCKETFDTPSLVIRHLRKVHHKSELECRYLRHIIITNVIVANEKSTQCPEIIEPAAEPVPEPIDPEQEWVELLDNDLELRQCWTCGKRFERKAALNTHIAACVKRTECFSKIRLNLRKNLPVKKGVVNKSRLDSFKGALKRKSRTKPRRVILTNTNIVKPINEDLNISDDMACDKINEDSNGGQEPDLLIDELTSTRILEIIGVRKDFNKKEFQVNEKSINNNDCDNNLQTPYQPVITDIENDTEHDVDCDMPLVLIDKSTSPSINSVNYAEVSMDIEDPGDLNTEIIETKTTINHFNFESTTMEIETKPPIVKIERESDPPRGQFPTVKMEDVCKQESPRVQNTKIKIENEPSPTKVPLATFKVEMICKPESPRIKYPAVKTERDPESPSRLQSIKVKTETDPDSARVKIESPPKSPTAVAVNVSNEIIPDDPVLTKKAKPYMNEEELLCIPCNERFASSSQLIWHMSKHFSWNRFQCGRCGFTSYNKYDCESHAKQEHTVTAQLLPSVVLPIPHWKMMSKSTDFQDTGITGSNKTPIVPEDNVMSYGPRVVAPANNMVAPANSVVAPANSVSADKGIPSGRRGALARARLKKVRARFNRQVPVRSPRPSRLRIRFLKEDFVYD